MDNRKKLSKKITSEQAELVHRKNLENIVRKAADGKILSRTELEILDSVIEKQDSSVSIKIRSWTALAKALGVSRKTVWDLRDKHNGPKEIDYSAWKQFLIKRANEQPHWQNEDNQSAEVRELRTKLLRAQAGKEEVTRKLKELEYKRTQAELVPMSDARDAIKKVFEPLRTLLDAHPKACAVQANPVDPQLAEEAIRENLQKIYDQIQEHRND